MITIFSTPRPFRDKFIVSQKNAIKSWVQTCPGCQIVLLDDEQGTTAEFAKELGLTCIKSVECDEFGTPILSDVFKKVKAVADNKIIVHINTDIILTDSFFTAIKKVTKILGDKPFFMSGRRWDLDVNREINFNNKDWQEEITDEAKEKGKLHGLAGMDYWVLPANFPFEIPPFSIGRPGMDSWLNFMCHKSKIPAIDATAIVDIIHQNHYYPQKKESFYEIQVENNRKLAGGFMNMCTLREADWILTEKGLVRPKFPRVIFSTLALFYPWRFLLAVKRKTNI